MRGERRGFVLLEAVVALIIVSITGIAVLSSVSAQLRARERAEAIVTADALGRERLQRFETLDHSELAFVPDSLGRGTFAPPFERYRWAARVERVPNERDLFELNLEIAWPESRYVLVTRLYRQERVVGE